MKSMVLRVVNTVVAISLLFCSMPAGVHAEQNKSGTEETLLSDSIRSSYRAYIERYNGSPEPEVEITITPDRMKGIDGAQVAYENVGGEDGVLKWENSMGAVEFKTDIEKEGLYHIAIEYYPLQGKAHDLEYKLLIDEQLPFLGADRLMFSRMWKDMEGIQRDNRDNDLRPRKVENPVWREVAFYDNEGIFIEPYKFFLEKGERTFKLICIREPVAIKTIRIYNRPGAVEYKEYAGNKPVEKDRVGFFEKYPAEAPLLKSHSSIHPVNDRSNAYTQPSHPNKVRMNTIGGTNWKRPGQWISWEVNAPEDGWYKIGTRYRQNELRGMFVNRKIMIDGSIPFKEAESVRFRYRDGWEFDYLSDNEGQPYHFYLSKGKHELTMEVSLGDYAAIVEEVQNCVFDMNDIYKKIVMITGPYPDLYRDYNLDKAIPNMIKSLVKTTEKLHGQYRKITEETGIGGSEAVILDRVAKQLESFIKEPETIPARLSKFKDNISTLSYWMMTIKEQPLEFDYIALASPDMKKPKANPNFLEAMFFEVRSFIGSFFENYSSIGNAYEDNRTIEVWVSLGRDQAYALRNLVDEYFTPQTGINVNVKIVPLALLPATMAGKGPDVALNIARSEPVNLALRGAIKPLNELTGYSEVIQRFMPTAVLPYELQGECYALPETQVFNMMFYRTDIFEDLGIEPPETWDDLYRIVPVIQNKNFDIGLPGDQSVFHALLMQNGGSLYKEDYSKTLLDSPEAFNAFHQWTSFYTQYSFPIFKDDYSRFRTGEMPLVIQAYTFYNLLAVGAPEIRNLWKMIPIPGTRMTDGSINRAQSVVGTASMIMADTKYPEEAWEFLRWWTSEEAQARYAFDMEAMMGISGRYTPASIEAFNNIAWTASENAILMSQWRQCREIPEVAGGYYIGRNIDNAFKAVTLRGRNPREMLYYWNKEINKEVVRKRIEFGLQ